MENNMKFLKNVMLIDTAFLNETVYKIKARLGEKLGRPLPKIDLPAWLSYLSLDAGLRNDDNEIQVLLVRDASSSNELNDCEPSSLEQLNGKACRTSLGEFQFSVVSTVPGIVSVEQLYLDLVTLILDAKEVDLLMLLPFQPAYGERVEKGLRSFFKEKNQDKKEKTIYFTLDEPLRRMPCKWDFAGYSLLRTLGVAPDELKGKI